MKILITAVVAMAFCAPVAAAPASAESVDRLLVVTHTEALIASVSGNVEQSMRKSIAQARGDKPMTAEEQKAIDSAVARVQVILQDEMTWSRLRPEYVRLYIETFDQTEVDGLLAFYATPAGKAMITKMPIVMQKSMAITQAHMQNLMPKIMATMQESMTQGKQAK